ncbi:methyl-accepting chemotaxis protein [Shewanella dokdonensis]|uniref:Methyl-accepting chemotaxis protein n=1 Tax=Shewanella dokdonensis TaxID=712036 RepID=A0ABX8DGF1_9GAMM|nr:methyl-accepting chemotaxis protein [Shewanella dokdonensis]MCL1074069.1 methyl-accepting chemotaxis protein [Shewanella dokdonensis]QVK23807.1 methyl-accepting chemotaxis protein [Shewanella dokdonensis]
MKITLKTRLLGASLAAVLIVSVILSSLSFSAIQQTSLNQTQEQIQQTGELFAYNIGTWFDGKKTGLLSLKRSLEAMPANQDPTFLLAYAQRALDYSLSMYGNEQGEMYRHDPALYVAGFDPRVRGWYKRAKSTGQLIIEPPHISSSLQKMVVTFCAPVIDQTGKTKGVVGSNVTLTKITDKLAKLKVPGKGFTALLQQDGKLISYPDKSFDNKPLTDVDPRFTHQWLQQLSSHNSLYEDSFQGNQKLFYLADIPGSDWSLLFVMNKDVIMAEANQLTFTMIVTAIIAILLFAVVLIIIFRSQFRDLENVSKALNSIASGGGDLTVRINTRHQYDEIGQLAQGFNRFVALLAQMVGRLGDVSRNLTEEAGTSRQVAESNRREIVKQLDDVTMVATAVTEMASATQEISSNAQTAAQTAEQAVTLAESGQQQAGQSRQSIRQLATEVGNATAIIAELDQHSRQINSILLTISDIAEQTNLLALNAAIEAARAGEQGRGFAVVADEVRVLSQRTHASTQEIQVMIATLQEIAASAVTTMNKSNQMTDVSVTDVEAANASLQQISAAIGQISDMARQIATAAEEQTSVTAEINRNTESIREVSGGLSTEAETSAKQAQTLESLAQRLATEVGQFRI